VSRRAVALVVAVLVGAFGAAFAVGALARGDGEATGTAKKAASVQVSSDGIEAPRLAGSVEVPGLRLPKPKPEPVDNGTATPLPTDPGTSDPGYTPPYVPPDTGGGDTGGGDTGGGDAGGGGDGGGGCDFC
jgi:hypothetical protein